jgi:glucose/arabinose dehydrogenase
VHRRKLAAGLALALVLGACSGGNDKPQPRPSTPSTTTTPTTGPSTPPSLDLAAVKIKLRRFATGLANPLFLTHAGDGSGNVYVVEQPGRIKVFDRDGNVRGTFLDIRSRIASGGERGLLGLAFHPKFAENRKFYVNYTRAADGDTIVAQYTARSATSADPGSERVLLHIGQPYPNHNGGWIGFGPDGYLYDAQGDGGSGGDPGNRAQNLGTMLGKILRIDVDHGSPYAIPSDNPFRNRSGARKEIWAYGLRNPWRDSFDRVTGDLFIGDVGQNSWEEIDAQPASSHGGVNYGWRRMEGNHCFERSDCNRSGLQRPVTEYSNTAGGACAVTGGYVYRGSAYPSLVGAYFFGDYCNGRIYALRASAAVKGPTSDRLVLDSGASISSFGEDASGELYITDLGGTVYRLQAA